MSTQEPGREAHIETLLAEMRRELLACNEYGYHFSRPVTPTGWVKDQAGIEWATSKPGPVLTYTLTLRFDDQPNGPKPLN